MFYILLGREGFYKKKYKHEDGSDDIRCLECKLEDFDSDVTTRALLDCVGAGSLLELGCTNTAINTVGNKAPLCTDTLRDGYA